MQPLWGLTACLGGLWIATLLYVELAAFWIPRWSCSWPDLDFKHQQQLDDRPVRVVLIADPQLTDRTSYGMAPGSLVLKLVQFYSDIYMRRAFRSSVLGLEPDEIIFLGDHFDGGPHLSDQEWRDSLKRFQHIFDQSERGLKQRSKQLIPVRYLSGNHDLGYHEVFSRDPRILQRYREKFGETDYVHKVGGVEFVVVNAQALDGGRSDGSSNHSWSFVESLRNTSDSRILLTHIPLYRSDNTPCGPARASPVINQRLWRANWSPWRITYQDYLTNETSYKLLDRIRPAMVFSGHDHDQCSVNHSVSEGFYPEHTVGTFSWQQGNIYPSFMMLSVTPHSSAKTDAVVSAALCFLPVQDFNYAWYAVLLVITILALLFWPSQGVDLMPAIHVFYNAIKASGSVKEKEDDAEWEMMWDAEGAMHLIRKHSAHSAPLAQSSERRGAAVQRAAARANALAAAEEVFDSDPTSFSSNHKRMNSWRRRLYQVFGPFTVLLAVNFSLYMMLMMKDWA